MKQKQHTSSRHLHPVCSALTLRMVEAARNRPTDLFGDAASRVSRLAHKGYLAETAAWNNVVDAFRELGTHSPNAAPERSSRLVRLCGRLRPKTYNYPSAQNCNGIAWRKCGRVAVHQETTRLWLCRKCRLETGFLDTPNVPDQATARRKP